MLPQPSVSFTLPSVYDGLELDCRLYFPKLNAKSQAAGLAIFAHPYAPLGGSYDDLCVQGIGSTLLRTRFVLTTFNFRGAEGSAGKTSWNGRAELGDYVSVYAFALRFMGIEGITEYIAQQTLTDHDASSLLILGGYSYGSMIAMHLPSAEMVNDMIKSATEGTSEYEITFRANELAEAFLGYCETHHDRGRSNLQVASAQSPGTSYFGGYESPVAARRASREGSRHSVDLDRVRHSVDRVRKKLGNRRSSGGSNMVPNSPGPVPSSQALPLIARLLVSPLLGPVSGLVTIFSKLKFEKREKGAALSHEMHAVDVDKVLGREPGLVVFGSDDHFTSSRKVKAWGDELQKNPQSSIKFCEISGAGHFWHDAEFETQLNSVVREWLTNIMRH